MKRQKSLLLRVSCSRTHQTVLILSIYIYIYIYINDVNNLVFLYLYKIVKTVTIIGIRLE